MTMVLLTDRMNLQFQFGISVIITISYVTVTANYVCTTAVIWNTMPESCVVIVFRLVLDYARLSILMDSIRRYELDDILR